MLSPSAVGVAVSSEVTSSASSGKGLTSVASVATAALLVAVASEGAVVPLAALTGPVLGTASEADGAGVNGSGVSCAAVNCSGVSDKGAGG